MTGDPVDGDDPADPADPFDGIDPATDGADDALPPLPADVAAATVQAAAAEPLNDTGNGARLCHYFGADLIWVPRIGWYAWEGTRWRLDGDEVRLRRLAQSIGPRIAAEAAHAPRNPADAEALALLPGLAPDQHRMVEAAAASNAARAALRRADPALWQLAGAVARDRADRTARVKWARASGNRARIDAVITEAAVHRAVSLDVLDANPMWINTMDGVVAVSVTADAEAGMTPVVSVELLAPAREHYQTRQAAVRWRPGATCPRFDAFLERIQPDAGMRAFLRRWFGLSLTGLTGEQKFAFFHGAGANGKGVLMNIMAGIAGDYAATARIESLTGRSQRRADAATPDLMPLIGARLVRASEPEAGTQLQEGTVKELTGGEPILVRGMYSDFIAVQPLFKLTVSGNHRPAVLGTDDGIWRRLLLVPFDVQIPADERDHNFARDILDAERDGIFQWAIGGLVDYLEAGLREPARVVAATSEFREESDPVGAFLAAACTVTASPADHISSRDMVDAFHLWIYQQALNPRSETYVTRRLKEKAGVWRDPATGRSFSFRRQSHARGYDGIIFQPVFRAMLDRAARDHHGRIVPGRPAGDAPGGAE